MYQPQNDGDVLHHFPDPFLVLVRHEHEQTLAELFVAEEDACCLSGSGVSTSTLNKYYDIDILVNVVNVDMLGSRFMTCPYDARAQH